MARVTSRVPLWSES